MAARKRARWMNEKDDTILEYLNSIHPSAVPPKVLHWNLEQQGASFSIDTTRRRLSRLVDYGLVEIAREVKSYHRITDSGRAYLAGELDASELESGEDS